MTHHICADCIEALTTPEDQALSVLTIGEEIVSLTAECDFCHYEAKTVLLHEQHVEELSFRNTFER